MLPRFHSFLALISLYTANLCFQPRQSYELSYSPSLPGETTKTELLFIHLILRALDMGGKCAVIVPGGVFKPYAGVSTAVLFFTRGARTERIWFYDMAGDGFSLDDKRTSGEQNDIPDILTCLAKRGDKAFQVERTARRETLKTQVEPLNAERMELEGELNRLTFEQAISADGDGPAAAALAEVKTRLEHLHTQFSPLRAEYNQLARQFWVSKEQVKANKYDLSASRYRETVNEEIYYEKPRITLERLAHSELVMGDEITGLRGMLE